MVRALTAEQARKVEEAAVAMGADLAALMRAAGLAVAAEITAAVPEGDVVVLAGRGNNGGDGWVAARELHASGRDVRVLSLAEPGSLGGIAGEAARDAIAAGVAWCEGGEARIDSTWPTRPWSSTRCSARVPRGRCVRRSMPGRKP